MSNKEKISLKSLSFATGENLELSPGTVTILVGPNNSGKSQALRDIESLCLGKKNYRPQVIKYLEMSGLPTSEKETKALLDPSIAYPQGSGYLFFNEKYNDRTEYYTLNDQEFKKIHTNIESIKKHIIPGYFIRLDGRTRFKLIDPEAESKNNIIGSHLRFLRGDKLETLNKVIKEIFTLYVIPERCNGFNNIENQDVCLKVSQDLPIFELMPNKWTTEQQKEQQTFYKNCEPLTEQGDGIQAFVGIMSAILVRPQTIILIDEPEAFLSPSIARRLGAELVNITKDRNASLVIATHSADFMMGCIESSEQTRLIRLTYENGHATIKIIESETIKDFDINPCLRSSSAIKSLFHKGIIVTEGHRDRVFYDEVNRRLLNHENKGMQDILFIDSGGGLNMIHKTLRPLRKMGLPAAALVDLDVITKANEPAWNNLLKVCGVDDGLKQQKEDVLNALLKIEAKLKKIFIENIDNDAKRNFQQFLNALALYGVFIVPTGELESWTPTLDKGKSWDDGWLEKIGLPEEKDFDNCWGFNKWSFINKIAEWIKNPQRSGMP